MSFLNPWKSSSGSKIGQNLPAVTPAERQRSKQVQWMRNEVNGLIEIEFNVLYRVQVNAGGQQLYIMIHLPPGFPKDPPQLTVSPSMVHSWIDDQSNIVGSPLLKNFSMHESLAKVINQVIKEFIEHPPRPAPPLVSHPTTEHSQKTLRPAPPVPVTTQHNTNIRHNPVHRSHRYTMPTIPEELPNFEEYSNEKLERFLHEIDGVIEVEQCILKQPIIVKIREDRSKILEQNESQARQNLSFEPELERAWDELQEKFLLLQTLRDDFKRLHEEHQRYVKKYQPSKVISILSSSIREHEHKNEQLAEEFLRKKTSVDDFLEDYLADRKLYYLRMGKQARLKDSNH